MAINNTTLSAAVGVTDTSVLLASITGVTAPNFQTGFNPVTGSGSSPVYLYVEQEWMQVVSVGSSASTPVGVKRGMLGSAVSAHGASAPVMAGLTTDFPGPIPISIKATQDYAPNLIGFSAPVTSANTITATGPFFHMTGTTIVKTINAPTLGPTGASGLPLDGSEITIVFDGSGAGLTWDATGNINVGGTATTAGSSVSFVFDQSINKWIPNRLA